MATLVDYKGLQVVSPEPTGDGGLAIQNDFKNLVDWNPKCVWNASVDPGIDNDETEDFYPGSMWLRTDTTPPKLFTCQSSAAGVAVWRELALTSGAVPYSGATGDVTLGEHQLQSSGLNAGFNTSMPNLSAGISGFWFPRTANLTNGWTLDYQDELAVIDLKGAVVTISPTPDYGNPVVLFRDDSNWVQYYTGTSPGIVTIEINATTTPILVKSLNAYSLGITFRSDSGSDGVSHVKIEVQSSAAGSYGDPVFDENIPEVNRHGQWVSPQFSGGDIYKLRISLSLSSPLPAEFRIQRIMLYHGTATYDPWHLSIQGGTLYGPLRVTGSLGTALSTKTAAYTLTASDSTVLCDASGGALTVSLPNTVGTSGRQYTIKRLNSGSNNVTIDGYGSQTIDGSTTLTLTSQYESAQLVSDGVNWWRV